MSTFRHFPKALKLVTSVVPYSSPEKKAVGGWGMGVFVSPSCVISTTVTVTHKQHAGMVTSSTAATALFEASSLSSVTEARDSGRRLVLHREATGPRVKVKGLVTGGTDI